jgi:hypothetical protein
MTSPLRAATSAITIEDVKDWRGEDVIDPGSEKLGKLEEVYYDTETDAPAFAAVKSGVLGKRITLVPLAGASAGRSYVRVGVDKDQFKGAPSVDPDTELSADDEEGTYRYYGLDYRAAGAGARRLAKH